MGLQVCGLSVDSIIIIHNSTMIIHAGLTELTRPPHPARVKRINSEPIGIPHTSSPTTDPLIAHTPFTMIDSNKIHAYLHGDHPPTGPSPAQTRTGIRSTTSLPLTVGTHNGGVDMAVSLRSEDNEWLSINLRAVAPYQSEGAGGEGWGEHLSTQGDSSTCHSPDIKHTGDGPTHEQVDIRNCKYLGVHTFTIDLSDRQQSECQYSESSTSTDGHEPDDHEESNSTVTETQHFTAVYLGMHSFSTPVEELPKQCTTPTDKHNQVEDNQQSDSLEFHSFDAVYLGMT